MPLFFPEEYRQTSYRTLYESLSPTIRLMVQREFVGVSYLRRFHLLKKQQQDGGFRREQKKAGAFIHRKLTINRLLWRRQELVRSHLKIIFRHYLFGFLVQLAGRKRELSPPPHDPACHKDTPINLTVLRWMNRHRNTWEPALAPFLEQVINEKIRHHFIYCLLAGTLAARIYNRDEMASECSAVKAGQVPGRTPIGLEMEFSNLGHLAISRNLSTEELSEDPFHNMEYYSAFQLEDVTWRLGGYLDSHEHGRRLFSLSRYGGFFEYSLVRVDYPRHYSLPLTTDPGIAGQMIDETVDFIPEIKPHSLHVNLEFHGCGQIEPDLDDFLCLLLLGGDLVCDNYGQLREKRFADQELHRFIKRRRHLSLRSESKKEVMEYAFLRLWRTGQRNYNYLPVILALKGFQTAYRLAENCLKYQPQLLAWANKPYPLPDSSLRRFMVNLENGLRSEGVYGERFLTDYGSHLVRILESRRLMINRHCGNTIPM
ncbi:MAG TPA: hypothetical protein ENN66_08475 [Proteobacteria bacterium]|nr:hypothetical protein [Pseudomonadota bacterium]